MVPALQVSTGPQIGLVPTFPSRHKRAFGPSALGVPVL